jgi:DNA repair ATPase RecN
VQQLEEELRVKTMQRDQEEKQIEEERTHREDQTKKEMENLREDIQKKSQRLSETNLALAKAAEKIEELSELKQGYHLKAKELGKELIQMRTELAQFKDFSEKLEKENKDFRKHLKFKDKELIRISKEKKVTIEKLKSELQLQVENNKNILEKMKNIKSTKRIKNNPQEAPGRKRAKRRKSLRRNSRK